jgi:hypothetical protein
MIQKTRRPAGKSGPTKRFEDGAESSKNIEQNEIMA